MKEKLFWTALLFNVSLTTAAVTKENSNGPICEKNNPCVNDAICGDTSLGYICKCPAGWEGDNCEIDVDECSKSPCGKGTCHNEAGYFWCECPSGLSGTYCENDLDECLTEVCKKESECRNTHGSYICICKPGWTGESCDQDINECESNPCQNGGQCTNNDGSFFCTCTSGWQGPVCDQGCSGQWKAILKTSISGTEMIGSKKDLVDRVVAGDDIRISFGNDNNAYLTTAQTAMLTGNGNVCVQSIFDISRSAYDDFNIDSHWNFLIICTTGQVHISRWSVGEHTKRGNTTLSFDINWYVRSQDREARRTYCTMLTGDRVCGDKSVLANAVNDGASIKVFNSMYGLLTSFTYIAVQNTSLSVVGQNPWQVSSYKNGDNYEFKTAVDWWLSIWSTRSTIGISQWPVGQHVNGNTTNNHTSMDWIVDDFWTQTYSHDSSGHGTYGSLDQLIQAVLAGKKVRVKIDSYIMEANNLYIRNGHVSAQLLGQFSTDAVYDFPVNVYWVWQMASTTGDVETVRYDIGSTENRGNSADKKAITWFVETRTWFKVLSTSSAGLVIHGSKDNLISSLRGGSPLRLIVHEATDTYSILEPENIAIQNSDVAAQSVRYISDENGSAGIPRQFKTPAYWRFTLTSTGGIQRAVWWKVGEHSSLPATVANYQVDWIVG